MYMTYRKHLDFINTINGEEEDIQLLRQQIVHDVGFITSSKSSWQLYIRFIIVCIIVALKEFNDEYVTKLKERTCSEKVTMQLAWSVKDLSDLNEQGRKIIHESDDIKQKIRDPLYDKVLDNFAGKLSSLCESAREFAKRITKYKRTAATHILVVMISPEQRSTKPYALPVQCIPYKSLKDSEARQIANNVVKEMLSRNMKVAGILSHLVASNYV